MCFRIVGFLLQPKNSIAMTKNTQTMFTPLGNGNSGAYWGMTSNQVPTRV